MITLTMVDKNSVAITAHYAYKNRIKGIPTAHWDYYKKAYVADISALPIIEMLFNDEIYYKTPKWRLHGEKKPKDIIYYNHEITVPEMKLEPYEYQSVGIKFMVDRILDMGFCLNGDAVGLGKTLEAIGTILWFREHQNAKKFLVICKKSLKYQWASEIEKFSKDDLNIFVAGDTPKKRQIAYDGIAEAEEGILITNYHNFLRDTDQIAKSNYDAIVIDEVHTLKAKKGKMNNNICTVTQGKKVILLSGTPVMSKPEDIFGIVQLATPNYFGTYKNFERNFLVTQPSMYGYHMKEVIGVHNINELQELIGRFMIRRTSDDVSLQLPEINCNGLGEDVLCEMDSTQEKMNEYISQLKAEIDEKKQKLLDKYNLDLKKGNIPEEIKEKIDDINEKSKQYIYVMQFIADDPTNFKGIKGTNPLRRELTSMVPKTYTMSNKVERTIDIVEEIICSGEKVLIFSHFATPARELAKMIQEKLKCDVVMYTGSENDAQREKSINAFVKGDCPVLIGTEAAAEGLNLQVTRYLINFEIADTYAQHTQRIGRLRRIGSSYSHLSVFNMVTEDSFDKIKLEKIKRDRNLAEALVDDAAVRVAEDRK